MCFKAEIGVRNTLPVPIYPIPVRLSPNPVPVNCDRRFEMLRRPLHPAAARNIRRHEILTAYTTPRRENSIDSDSKVLRTLPGCRSPLNPKLHEPEVRISPNPQKSQAEAVCMVGEALRGRNAGISQGPWAVPSFASRTARLRRP